MRIAVISDIHSNIQALEAVLDHIAGTKPDFIICTGDLVGYGANPNQVIGLIRQRNILTVLGNYDDGVGNRRPQCGCDFTSEEAARLGHASLAWTIRNTSEENRTWLSQLPRLLQLTTAAGELLFCHGSPRQINEYMYQDSTPLHQEILNQFSADIIICGHTHLAYHRIVDGRHIINAGSVGKPKNGRPEAVYTVMDIGKGFVDTRFISVPYNFEAAARAIEAEADLPNEFAQIIRTGG